MNFQVISLKEFMVLDNNELDDGFASASEYVRERAAPEQIYHPSVYDDQFLNPVESNELRIGEITQLLQNTPGTLGHVDKLPETSVIDETNDDMPDVILNEKIPIFLGDKYFKFQYPEENDDDVDNDDEKVQEKKANSEDSTNELVIAYSTIFADDKHNNGHEKTSNTNGGEAHAKSKWKNSNTNAVYFNAFEVYKKNRVSSIVFFFYFDIK